MATRYTYLFNRHVAGESWSTLAARYEDETLVAVAETGRPINVQDSKLPTFSYRPLAEVGRPLREWIERGDYEERAWRFTPRVPAQREREVAIEGFLTTPEEDFRAGGSEPV